MALLAKLPLVALGAAACLVAAGPARAVDPNASFSYTPPTPIAGQSVRFVSSSCDPDGRLTQQAWDFGGGNTFTDASGRVARFAFPTPGTHTVGLRVTDDAGNVDVRRMQVTVGNEYTVPTAPTLRPMSPPPIVHLAGSVTGRITLIRLLTVRAPICARVRVSCEGRCPKRSSTRFVGPRALRFRAFEARLRAGTALTVRVSKGDLIGKYTRFVMRSDKRPRRIDRCLLPGASQGSRCPQD